MYISEKLWGFQTMCNPHPNYMHITGYPVRHGSALHFLWGKHLQCRECYENKFTKTLRPTDILRTFTKSYFGVFHHDFFCNKSAKY